MVSAPFVEKNHLALLPKSINLNKAEYVKIMDIYIFFIVNNSYWLMEVIYQQKHESACALKLFNTQIIGMFLQCR